ncbi:MAG: TetR/AcrR family transcriptional regulator [Cyanobacteria bacterium P01_H01_bin.15]
MARTKKVGRPRSTACRAAILETAWKLIRNTTLKELSIEGIARESGVGKSTIYRWWPSKVAVVMDAFVENVLPIIEFAENESVAVMISQQIAALVRAFSGEYGHIVAQILAEGQADPEALASYRDRLLYPRREAAKALIQRGIENGEFVPTLDPELALDILYGPIYFRLLVGHLPLDAEFAEGLPKRALKALAVI